MRFTPHKQQQQKPLAFIVVTHNYSTHTVSVMLMDFVYMATQWTFHLGKLRSINSIKACNIFNLLPWLMTEKYCRRTTMLLSAPCFLCTTRQCLRTPLWYCLLMFCSVPWWPRNSWLISPPINKSRESAVKCVQTVDRMLIECRRIGVRYDAYFT